MLLQFRRDKSTDAIVAIKIIETLVPLKYFRITQTQLHNSTLDFDSHMKTSKSLSRRK